jgi:hypothetical protein
MLLNNLLLYILYILFLLGRMPLFIGAYAIRPYDNHILNTCN